MQECQYEEKIMNIRETAFSAGGKISYMVLADMLKDGATDYTEKDLERAIGELIEDGIEFKGEDEENYVANKVLPDTFVPADVQISSKTFALWNLLERLEYEEINLQPDFQRRSGLWDMEKQSRLIESLMLKIPLPAFYFDASNEEKWNVIDGLQRLTAFQNFLVGTKEEERKTKGAMASAQEKKGLQRLCGLQYMAQFNGCTFDELPRQYQRRIREAQIVIYTVEKGTPNEIVFNIFQRINTGGLQLEDQEIRNALYQGKATDLTRKLAGSKEFLEATQYAVPSDRMMDREYITRYLAFTQLPLEDYRENIDAFLSEALKKVNQYTDPSINEIEDTFKFTMNICHGLFGTYAFRTFRKNGRRGPINKALFELWSVCLHTLTKQQAKALLLQKKEFMQDLAELLEEQEFRNALRGGDIFSVRKRIAQGKKLLGRYV